MMSASQPYSEYPAGGAALDVEPGRGPRRCACSTAPSPMTRAPARAARSTWKAPLINGQPVSTLQIADSTFQRRHRRHRRRGAPQPHAGVGLFHTTIAGNTDPAVTCSTRPLTLGNTLIAANGASGDG